MSFSWIKRSSLKQPTKKRYLYNSTGMNKVKLLSLMGLVSAVGVFVVQHSLASGVPVPTPTPTPTVTPTPTTTPLP